MFVEDTNDRKLSSFRQKSNVKKGDPPESPEVGQPSARRPSRMSSSSLVIHHNCHQLYLWYNSIT
jgi:hypothetical protein